MIDEIDVWHMGSDEELSTMVDTAKGKQLEGHPDMVCVHACLEEEAPIAQARPEPRVATAEEILAGKHLVPGPIVAGDGKPATRMIQLPTPDPRPGRKRVRLNYRAAAS